MIQSNELRIGNYVIFSEDSTILMVGEISEKGLVVQNEEETTWIEIENFDPIPLTEGILLKCGFEVEKSADIYEYDIYSIQISNNRSLCYCKHPLKNSTTGEKTTDDAWWFDDYFGPSFTNFGDDFWCKIKHLHQLQNLYYALTGEELNIEL